MNKTIAHLLYIPFTGLGNFGGYRGDKWLLNRIKVFKEYVIPSLVNQSSLNFVIWATWRPEEKENPIVQELYKHLEKIDGLSVVFTYHGIPMYDDKYPEPIARERLLNTLIKSLPEIRNHVEHADEVLLTCQPSDDMFLSHAVKTLQATDFGDNKATGWTNGYIINYATKEIAEYNPTTIPPFSTIRFPKDVFLDPYKHFEWSFYKSHEDVKDLGFKELPGRGYIVGTHGANISTTYNIPYKGRVLDKGEADMVLLKAGVLFSQPIKMNTSRRIIARNLYNYLPFKGILKKLYYKTNLHKKLYV